jgi:hypothetical protein
MNVLFDHYRIAVAGFDVVFAQRENSSGRSISGILPGTAFPAGMFKGRPIAFVRWESDGANQSEWQTSAVAAGHFDHVVGISPGYVTDRDWNDGGMEWLTLDLAQRNLRIPVDDEVSAGRVSRTTQYLPLHIGVRRAA